jgi:hypothetical protein
MEDASTLLKTYQVAGRALYVVGTFDVGVTVLSQQIRALNFVWAAIESGLIQCFPSGTSPTAGAKNVAIVGGGFSGLSLAAGLLSKNANAHIYIFEQRDALMPLQQGSDSRWLHPRIYDWPGEGSQAGVAMLPILNWTAARASDVVVQLMTGWGKIVTKHVQSDVVVYCNARHLQIHQMTPQAKGLHLEWVGERRAPADGRALDKGTTAEGQSRDFDVVVLATGFGLERDGASSYWRNEILGQPSLDKPRQTYLVSGQGDGAMIDLLRLRVSQYRQDRILEELFRDRKNLLRALKELHRIYTGDMHKKGLFGDFEALGSNEATQREFRFLYEDLVKRLRRDTEVILHLRVKKLSELFDLEDNRISFQNKLLVYLVYKCGGFIPSALKEEELIKQHGIDQSRIVRRHGTLRDEQLEACLSDDLFKAIATQRGTARPDPFSQIDREQWPGGYFGYAGKFKDASRVADEVRVDWRQEYLPGPVELLATTFCSSIAGLLLSTHKESGRLRVTFHRTLSLRDEELLQQSCDYAGTINARGEKSTAARTFPAAYGTIGLAYKCRQIARSKSGVDPAALGAAMKRLNLNEASRKMSDEVRFVLAIPLLQPEQPGAFTAPKPVAGIIYIDSTAEQFFVDDDELRTIVAMADQLLGALERAESRSFDRICNMRLRSPSGVVSEREQLPEQVSGELELVMSISPPRTSRPFQFSHDYSDFVEVQGDAI